MRRIQAWIEVQTLYIPGVARLRKNDSPDGQNPETVALHMPATIFKTVAVDKHLLRYEWEYRYAEALTALGSLRGHLLLLEKMYLSKNRFARGQAHNTRSTRLLERVQAKVQLDKARYRHARQQLVALGDVSSKAGWEQTLQVLNDADVRGLGRTAEDLSEGHRTLSWIWKKEGVATGEDGEAVEEGLPSHSTHQVLVFILYSIQSSGLSGARRVHAHIVGKRSVPLF